MRLLATLGIIVSFMVCSAGARERTLMDSGWRFRLGDPPDVTTNVTVYPEISNLAKLQSSDVDTEVQLESERPDPVATHAGENVSFVETNYDDSAWRSLNLPHDWVVELGFTSSGDGSHGYKATSGNTIGWYRRTFTLPSSDTGKVLWLEFDGIYRNALIWMNGHCVGRDASGYAPISFNVTPYANPGGTNVLVVRVDASRNEGWFYEGAGIYRHVWLEAVDPVHVAHWGTFVATTTLADSNATVVVQTTVTNESTASVTGNLFSTIRDADSNSVVSANTALNLAAGAGVTVTQTLAATGAHPWSLNSPYLYDLVSTVSNQNAAVDVCDTTFGIRTVRFDPTNGVFINGEHVIIQGMCNHQDHAGVGAALPDRLQYFRIERLKEMGVNAYRTSHNAPTTELLQACDRLGMLVLDENRRLGYDPETLGQLRRMVLRDRNHPSIFCWSLANEEPLQGSSTGATVIRAMQDLVHSLDPTRLCTAAMNGGWTSAGFSQVLDVVGFNYSLGSVDSYHASHPGTNIIGTETASTVTDRGIYTNDPTAGYVAGYDIQNPGVGWGEPAESWWPFYHARPWSSGGFCWTGFDYRGEPTPYGWPCINSHFGIMDTCGFPKDLFFYYQANWTLKPVLHLFPHWNWPGREGQPIDVWVFGNCDLVELFLNGVSQGERTLDVEGHAEWTVPYAPGTLQAVGYLNGEAILTNTVATTGAPAAISLAPDRDTILADGRDVSVVTVAVLDSEGHVVPSATNLVQFTVIGGAIIGVGNGDPSSHEADKASQRSVFNGMAEVIVQSTNQPGPIVLTANSAGLTSTNVTITAASTLPPPAVPFGVRALAADGRVTVSWDVDPGATAYNVKRAASPAGPYTVVAANIAPIGFIDPAVTNLVAYYYIVSAVNASGEGAACNPVAATPHPPPPPLPPKQFTAVRGDTEVFLSWMVSSGATSYNVKYSLISGGSYTVLTNLTGTALDVTNLANGTTYYFVVSGVNATGEGADSVEVSATPTPLVAGLTASLLNGQVQLQWSPHAGAAGYNVKRALVSGGPYTPVAENLPTTAFTDSTVGSCQDYYYVVTMTIGGVESEPSDEVRVTVPGPLPAPLQSADVGSVGAAGNASYCGGQYIVTGSGADIWGTADGFQFVYVYVPEATNCEIRAHVLSVQDTHSNAKAAVMIRESLTAGSRHALADVEPTSGIEFLWRTDTGSATSASVDSGLTAPYWIRLTRTNNVFRAYRSPDGAAWTEIGSPVTIPMAEGAYMGLAVNSHNNGVLCTAVFDHVSIPSLPAGAPLVIQNPASATRYVGGSLNLVAGLSGDTPLSFQWRLNDTAVSGGTNGGPTIVLPLSDLNVGQAGSYVLYVTNTFGFTNTAPATVTVITPDPGSYAERIVTNHPLAYWRLNENGNPPTAFDYVNGNDLSNTGVVSTNGVPEPGFGTTPTAAWYDGATSGSSGSAPLMSTLGRFTICGWFEAASLPQPARTGLFGQNDLAELGFHYGPLGIWVASPAAGGILVTNSTVVLDPNTWYFVAATADGTNVNLYLNGSLIQSLPGSVTNSYNSVDPFQIGAGVLDRTGDYFHGAVEDVALFDRALAPAEVQALYQTAFAVPLVRLNIEPAGNGFRLIWSPAVGTLQSSGEAGGSYTNIPGATSPYTNTFSETQQFFRVLEY